MGSRHRRAAVTLAVSAWVSVFAGLLLASSATAACNDDQVLLRGDWGTARFSVEVADDDAERAQGLMNRENLASAAGMLFWYETPSAPAFWMRNTLIPLDMIFLDPQGRVVHVHENARPLDETPISGGPGVQAVLEINGGFAGRLGIAPGTELQHSLFGSDAAWPC